MKAPLNKILLLVLMCLCLFGCSTPEAPTAGEQKEPAKELVRAPNGPVKGESFSITDINLEMLWCKPGTFQMGSPEDEEDRDDDETQYKVNLTHGFWLGKYEVTQEQWQKVMGSNPSWFNGATLPVETVSWTDAMEFCRKVTERERRAGRLPDGYRYTLPAEAQWEYACRAGTRTRFSFGDLEGSLYQYGNYADRNVDFDWADKSRDDGHEHTAPVGSYKANAWGFHDMHGNVWEWCLDWYGEDPAIATDPVGPRTGSARVDRGGGWYNDARVCCSAYRNGDSPGRRDRDLGFRLALSPEE